MRLLRGSAVLFLTLGWLVPLFQLRGAFWTTGVGDWVDPYFINYLLEHWYRSVTPFGDPTSPPMFFPAEGTLGYSHGLILYAPIYAALRPFLHPFQAYNLTLFVVMLAGTLCLYVIFRRFLSLSFVTSLLLTAFFAASRNVTNGFLGIWSQRASVFLIPPILLIALAAARMKPGAPRAAVAATAGFLTALLYTQDYYTAHFAMLFVALALVPWLVTRDGRQRLRGWRRESRSWIVPFASGALAGGALFVWIYLDAYREHRGFPEAQLLTQLLPWGARGYESIRSFVFAGALALLARSAAATWLAVVSLLVFLIPFQFGGFSIWRTLLEPLPGFDVIRDPKRIIYLYELALVLGAGVLLSQMRDRRLVPLTASVLMAVLLVVNQTPPAPLDFLRPNATFARWVESPVAIDPSCRSFFTAPASRAYTSRPDSAWSLTHLDAMWISLALALPTLNGYSAWNPTDWAIGNPDEPGYLEAVRDWAARHRLEGVCALDIEARRISPLR